MSASKHLLLCLTWVVQAFMMQGPVCVDYSRTMF